MSIPRFRLVWGASRAVEARWFFGLVGLYDRGRRVARGVVISGRGLLAWGAVAAAVAYVGLTTAWFFWLERRPHNQVTWTDAVLAPVRWPEIQRKRGQAYIDAGMDDLRAQRWAEGTLKIRLGLERQPNDRRARLQLARFYVAARLRARALATLEQGLAGSYPGRDYMEALIGLARAGEDHELALRVIARGLAAEDAAARRDREWLEQNRLVVLLAAGRPEEVVAATAGGGVQTAALNELRTVGLIDLGRPREAVAFLEQWGAERGRDQQVVRLLVRAWREAGDVAAMNAALEELRAMAPADPRPAVFAVVQRALVGGGEEAAAGCDDYIFRFGARAANLQLLATPLAEVGRRDLVERVRRAAAERGFAERPYWVLLATIDVRDGRWEAAREALEKAGPAEQGSEPGERLAQQLLEQVVAAALDGSAGIQLVLTEHLRQRPLPLASTRLVVEAMRRAGRWETARQVVGLGLVSFPNSATLQGQRSEIEAALAAQASAQAAREPVATAPVASDAPGPAVVASAPSAATAGGQKEEVFFRRLQAAVGGERWPEVLELAAEARRARPAWLGRREADVLRAEIEARLARDEVIELISAVRRLLDGTNARGLEGMEIVRRLDESGRRATARLVLAEVLKRQPEFPPALRQLRAWVPPEAA